MSEPKFELKDKSYIMQDGNLWFYGAIKVQDRYNFSNLSKLLWSHTELLTKELLTRLYCWGHLKTRDFLQLLIEMGWLLKMDIKKGQFGKGWADGDLEDYCYGYYFRKQENGVGHVIARGEPTLDSITHCQVDHFIPCHEPLPLEPSFKEWATFMMGQMPNIIKIEKSNSGCVYLINDDRDPWRITGHSEGYECYTRADLFPEPEPDWSQYIECFGEFKREDGETTWGYWMGERGRADGKKHMFVGPDGLLWDEFTPGLPPAKLGESEGKNG